MTKEEILFKNIDSDSFDRYYKDEVLTAMDEYSAMSHQLLLDEVNRLNGVVEKLEEQSVDKAIERYKIAQSNVRSYFEQNYHNLDRQHHSELCKISNDAYDKLYEIKYKLEDYIDFKP